MMQKTRFEPGTEESLDITVTRMANDFSLDPTLLNDLYDVLGSDASLLAMTFIATSLPNPDETLRRIRNHLYTHPYRGGKIDCAALLTQYREYARSDSQ